MRIKQDPLYYFMTLGYLILQTLLFISKKMLKIIDNGIFLISLALIKLAQSRLSLRSL